MKIHFYWVWAALNKTMDNTYFLIEDWGNKLQVDCSWGLWLAQLVNRLESEFENLFITHKHTNHLLWFFHLLRVLRNWKIKKLNVYSSMDLEKTIRETIELMDIGSWKKALEEEKLIFKNIEDKEHIKISNFEIEIINLYSEKIEQHWFLLTYKAKKILFFWDEAVWVLSRDDLDRFIWVDYLICEALNPEFMNVENWWKVHNKKISHCTAREAWIIWEKLKVKNLILVHTLEDIPWNRQEILKEEAALEFSWNIIVPNPWDILEI